LTNGVSGRIMRHLLPASAIVLSAPDARQRQGHRIHLTSQSFKRQSKLRERKLPMKSTYRTLFLIVLTIILIMSLIGIATSGTIKSKLHFPQDCAQNCSQTHDKTMESCNQLSGEARDRCIGVAEYQYKKCTEGCSKEGGPSSGQEGGSGGSQEGERRNNNRRPQ
jgi:hypothetical protein